MLAAVIRHNRCSLLASKAIRSLVFGAAPSQCPISPARGQQPLANWLGNTHFSLAASGDQWYSSTSRAPHLHPPNGKRALLCFLLCVCGCVCGPYSTHYEWWITLPALPPSQTYCSCYLNSSSFRTAQRPVKLFTNCVALCLVMQ